MRAAAVRRIIEPVRVEQGVETTVDLEPDTILFGAKGEDDWAFAPDVIGRLDDAPEGYLILEEDDEDEDPIDAESDWPVLPGNQIVWIDDGNEAEPLAVVTADRAGQQDTLEEIAREWARGADGVEIEVGDTGEVHALYTTRD